MLINRWVKRDTLNGWQLLLFVLCFAIIYLIWSNGAKYFVCPKCKNKELIPVNSDNGRKLALAADPEILENIANKKTL